MVVLTKELFHSRFLEDEVIIKQIRCLVCYYYHLAFNVGSWTTSGFWSLVYLFKLITCLDSIHIRARHSLNNSVR